MKRRWSILFWSSLSALIGMSWLTRALGIPFTTLISAALLGMIAASAVAFYAMIRAVPAKWPAAVVLAAAGPLAIEVVGTLPDIAMIVRYFGPSFALVIGGTLATVVTAFGILVAPSPAPLRPPQVPEAKVVD